MLGAPATAGVAGFASVDWPAYAEEPAAESATWIANVRAAREASPVPEPELARLDALFGVDRLVPRP